MIILDTSVLRSFGPESSTADLLRTIGMAVRERVGAPWMVMEELAAQQAIKYHELYERAAHALEALRQATPWSGLDVRLGECDVERAREHWRSAWSRFVEVIPTSDSSLRQALFREANCLAPCKESKNQKTGSRDAAIWLSAVEYARRHPDETVYFVSANTKDFGDGTSYPYPMNEDIEDLGEKFVHLTSMDEVAVRFTEPAEVDEARVTEILGPAAVSGVPGFVLQRADDLLMGPTARPDFNCTIPTTASSAYVGQVQSWATVRAYVGSVGELQAYRVGGYEWCIAPVDWHLIGMVRTEMFGAASAAVSWMTVVLFRLDQVPHPTILRASSPGPVNDEVAAALGIPPVEVTDVELAVAETRASLQDRLGPARFRSARLALSEQARQQRNQQMRMGETSAG